MKKIFLFIISIGLLSLVSCEKEETPIFKLNKKILINESGLLFIRPSNFTIVDDTVFAVINEMQELRKYSLKTGKLISSFNLKDSLKLNNIYDHIMQTLPKRNYCLTTNENIAKTKFNSRVYDIRSFYFDGKKFHIYSSFLIPYIGSYLDYESATICSRAYTLITTDNEFNIKNIKRFSYYFKRINPVPSSGFITYEDYLYSNNYVILNSHKIDSLYPVLNKIKIDNICDTINNTPKMINDIYFPPNSPIHGYNNTLKVFSKFRIYNNTLYVSVTNSIFNVNTRKKIYSFDNNIKIKSFEVNNTENYILFTSLDENTKQFFLNKKIKNNFYKKELILKNKKIVSSYVYNNKIYLLTKDQENYYVEEYIID